MKATIYRLITPDDTQMIYGYRWRIKYHRVSIIGDIVYDSEQQAVTACKRFCIRLNIPLTIDKKIIETHDFDFLV